MRFAVVHGDIRWKDYVYLKVKDIICVVYKISDKEEQREFLRKMGGRRYM